MIVTISWDDGHKLNLRLAELLNKYNIRATFYLAKDYDFSQPDSEIKKIAETQEIGAHTLSHPDLTKISVKEARLEIEGGKKWLEGLLGQPVESFAYPSGFYNEKVKELVKEAGFESARTVECFDCYYPKDSFAWKATIHAYPHPFRKRSADKLHLSRHLGDPLFRSLPGMIKWYLPPTAYFSWLSLAKATFDYVKKQDGIWHMWGHSWEIEKYDMWQDLENLFIYINQQKNVRYLTNSEAIKNKK
jgi:peptidoglycan-N-acetylglucosamine deacetylase